VRREGGKKHGTDREGESNSASSTISLQKYNHNISLENKSHMTSHAE